MVILISLLDGVSASSSLMATYYFIRLAPCAWIISLLAICLNSYLYWKTGIYAEMGLEFIYFCTTCYGLLRWRHDDAMNDNAIQPINPKQSYWIILTLIILALSIEALLSHYTNSTVPIIDALTTSLSIIAQWLMCKKIITTWILWFITDGIYTYLYFLKGLPFHMVLMGVYCVMAVIGYFNWIKLLKLNQSELTS